MVVNDGVLFEEIVNENQKKLNRRQAPGGATVRRSNQLSYTYHNFFIA